MIDRLMDMFRIVSNDSHGSLWVVLSIGIIFGSILQYSRVDKFEKIAGFAMLRDTVVPKMLFLGIGLTAIVLYFMIEAGYASYHVKPLMLGGIIIGGAIFGASMAIFGKCPGTGPVSIAEGRLDVVVGSIGGIFGGLFFTVYYDEMKIIMGESLGNPTLATYFEGHESLVVLIFGLLLVGISIAIPLVEEFDQADLDQLDS